MKRDYVPIAVTIFMLIAGTTLYVVFGSGGMQDQYKQIYDSIQLKAAYSPEGKMKLFAYAGYNLLSQLKASEGKPIPEESRIVLGSIEAQMMKEEGIFSYPGDTISGFFGRDTVVEGILKKTDTPLDEMHFLSGHDYSTMDGNEVYLRLTDKGMPKLFYQLRIDQQLPPGFSLAEGNLSWYSLHEMGGEEYYPLILGNKEADMMREEGLFSAPGDLIKGFFGRNVIIAGILNETGSAMDMMHFVPWKP